MKKIKISLSNLGTNAKDQFYIFKHSLIYGIIKYILCKEIEIVPEKNADIHFFGPYNENTLFTKIIKFTNRKLNDLNLIHLKTKKPFEKIENKPIYIFYSNEMKITEKEYDFAFTNHYGMPRETHFRVPLWKELVDWSHLGINREKTNFIKRFSEYYKITDLIKPLGENFFKKKKNICLFTSHLSYPRNIMYQIFSKHFIVDGYGPYFDRSIKNHNSSNFSKKNILSNYAFNLCPENNLCPGCYSEKIPEAFLGGSLPLGYADHNINIDFNKNAFVNLIDYAHDDYSEICELLKDDIFLKKFTTEPLLFVEPNLEKEINFVKKIISYIH